MLSSSPAVKVLISDFSVKKGDEVSEPARRAEPTQTAHQPLVPDARHDVRLLLGTGVVFGLLDAVGILEG